MIKKVETNFVVLVFLLVGLISAGAENQYEPNIESLKHYQVPEWYQDAKLGVWAHWGVYSVPAFGGKHAAEWYPRHMYNKSNQSGHYEHHRKTYGPQDEFGYKDFIPMFKAEKFNPEEWIQLALDTGAKFYSVVTQHHDGFAMYDSDFTKWNCVDMGPKRDITKELFAAARARGLKVGASSHFAFNFQYYEFLFKDGGDYAEAYKDLYSDGKGCTKWFMERWWNRTTEVVTKYNPDLYYFDWGWNRSGAREVFNGERERFLAFYYNHAIKEGKGSFGDPGVVMNFKGPTLPTSVAVQDTERGGKGKVMPYVWQCCTSISKHSWGYSEKDTYWPTDETVDTLVDVVSKNGVMFLNFGPRADGTIPDEFRLSMLELGQWLKINGEAIYSTRPFVEHGEGPTVKTQENRQKIKANGFNYTPEDIRFTRNKANDTLYVFALDWPENEPFIKVKMLSKKRFDTSTIRAVSMVGSDEKLRWKQDGSGLSLELPKKKPSDFAHAFKIEFKGKIPGLK